MREILVSFLFVGVNSKICYQKEFRSQQRDENLIMKTMSDIFPAIKMS